MHSQELLEWLKKYKLFSIAKNHSVHFRNVLKISLKAKNESVLIIGDYGRPRHRVPPLMSGAYYLAVKKLGLDVDVVMQDSKNYGDSADLEVVDAFKKKCRQKIIILNLSNKIGRLGRLGKSYRRYIKEKRYRFVSTPGLASINTNGFYSITRALNINYAKLKHECGKLKKALDWGREVVIQTNAGTDIKFNITGCKSISNDGLYDSPGHGGNMPAGEVYIPPKINTAEGRVVIDCTSRNKDDCLHVDKPIVLTVKKGIVTSIEGGSAAEKLKKTVAWAKRRAKNPSMVGQIGELGIGMNPKASISGAMIIDEKVLGTAHVALGSNYWFGGDVFTIIHLDQVFKNPLILIDGKEYKTPKRIGLL